MSLRMRTFGAYKIRYDVAEEVTYGRYDSTLNSCTSVGSTVLSPNEGLGNPPAIYL